MLEYFKYVITLIREQFAAVFSTDLSQVEFANIRWAIGGAIVLVLSALSKLFYWWKYGRKRTARQSSGHSAIRGYPYPLWKRLVYQIPRILYEFATFFLLIALARPYVTNYYSTSKVKSTEICYLEDASSSMAERFGVSEKSKAEIAREALLEFLRLRKGKADRACFWIFSSNPHKIEDFTREERSFMFQVYNAPWVFDYGSYSVPSGKAIQKSGEGGTDMDRALQALAKYFDSEGARKDSGAQGPRALRRVLLIITDAEVNSYPEQGFTDIAGKHIVPYLIYLHSVPISPHDDYESASSSAGLSGEAKKFVDAIDTYGGKSFVIPNSTMSQRALARAFAEIDRIEKVESEQRHYSERIEIFQLPLAICIALTLCAILLAVCMTEIKFGRYP